MKFLLKSFLSISLYLFPILGFAQTFSGDSGSASQGSGLTNPLKNATLMGFLQDILDVIMVFAIPLIVFMIIYAGFMYVTAQGEPGKIGQAHKALLYAVIGGVIILAANVILAVIQGTVDAFRY